MKKVLVIYSTHDGRTARMSRRICQTIQSEGHEATMMDVIEADLEGVDLSAYDLLIFGAGLRYGEFNKGFRNYVNRNREIIDSHPNSMFTVTSIARRAEKATIEGNVYARKFLENSQWKPRELVCFGGKIDYPRCNLIDRFCIWLIMVITKGPKDLSGRFDFTDWNQVEQYAKHCLSLE